MRQGKRSSLAKTGKRGTGAAARKARGSRQRRRTRHLFENWKQVAKRLKASRRIALFLDFDGTLTPIRPHPAEVSLPSNTRRILKRLARRRDVNVCVISGRRGAEVRRLVNVPGVTCVGLHGWDRGNKGRGKQLQSFVARLRREVEEGLAGFEGIWVEDKSVVFVVHYRRATAAAARRARQVLGRILSTVSSRIRLMEGKKVWEVLPREVKGKGAAVRALLSTQKGKPFPIYLGDDTTDEDAFKVLRGGLTVRVGTPRPTRARYELRDPDEVAEFLVKLEAETA